MDSISLEFSYRSIKTIIQSSFNEKINEVFLKYSSMIKEDINSLMFLYNGQIINEELTIQQVVNEVDKRRKKMNILASDLEEYESETMKKSEIPICPKCGENIIIDIKDYKIKLYDCKNKHEIDYMNFFEYENTQKIDEAKIICGKCHGKKSETFNNEFYRCISCKINLCPLCKIKHNNSHEIINYEDKNYICEIHNEFYFAYCKQCKSNICLTCQSEHDDHDIISFGKILPKIDNLKKYREELKTKVNNFKNKIEEIIKMLNRINKSIEIFYKINDNLINFYLNSKKKRNYQILYSLNELKNQDHFINTINEIINDNNIKNLYNTLSCIEINKLKKKPTKESNSINISFEASTGLKTELCVSEKISVKELLKMFAKKVNLSESYFGKEVIFLLNGKKLDHESLEEIKEVGIGNNSSIIIFDQSNVIGK